MSLQAAELLAQAESAIENGTFDAMLDGASDEALASTDTPAATDAKPAEPAQVQAKTEGEQPKAADPVEPPEGTPIASKSGEYTIPYEKLASAREASVENARQRDLAIQERDQAIAERDALKAQQAAQGQQTHEQNVRQAQAAIADGANVELFGDFSEEAIAKGVATLNAQAVAAAEARFDAKLEAALAPFKAQQQTTAEQAHFAPIYARHPDADEFTGSKEFADWQASLPSHVKRGVEQVMADGTPAEIVEVFDSFKAAIGKPTTAAAAPVTLPEAKNHVPASLSEIAGAPPVDEVERVLSLTGDALTQAMQGLTSEQMDRVLNRIA